MTSQVRFWTPLKRYTVGNTLITSIAKGVVPLLRRLQSSKQKAGKVIEDSGNTVDNSPILFNIVLLIVTSIDTRLKTIEIAIETINEIKKDILLISSKIRIQKMYLETVVIETNTVLDEKFEDTKGVIRSRKSKIPKG